jgi:hypothetical protein
LSCACYIGHDVDARPNNENDSFNNKDRKIIKKRELKRKLRAYARSQPDH